MHADHVLGVLGAGIVVLGLSSRIIKRYALSPMVLALALGIAVGPHALDVVDPTDVVPRGKLLEQVSRVALALAVFDIALRSKPSDLRRNAARLAVLLLVVMPGMWLVSAAGASLLLGIGGGAALVVGAALTPTDPGVASALVSGVLPNRSLPRRVRMTLELEAAANDGLALPIVILAGTIATRPAGEVLGHWAPEIAVELAVAVAVGAVVGLLVHRLVDLAGVDRLAEEDWFPLASAGTAIGALALAHLLGGSGVLAAFVAGLAFSEGMPEQLREPIHQVHRSITKLAVMFVLLTLGTVAPVEAWWSELGLAGLAFGVWVLVLRRFPVAHLPLRLTGTGPRSSALIGWSGPLGVAGTYYLAYAERYHLADYERLFAAGTLAIACSIAGHALTSALVVRAYRASTGQEVAEGEELVLAGPLP